MTANQDTSRVLPPIGLIAGNGRMPVLVAQGIGRAGRSLAVVAIRDQATPRLASMADSFSWVGVARVGSWIRELKRAGVRQAVMIGGVHKKAIYSPMRVLRYIPDLRTMHLWYVKVRKDRRDNAILLAVADELAAEGIELISSVEYCKEHLANEGTMTRTAVPRGAAADIEFGWRIARASADLDIGQSLAVRERDIIAVEAMEGTNAMIHRAGELCPTGGWTLIKVARGEQDMRFDVPTIGPETIRSLKTAGCTCLVVEAGRTLIVDKPVTLALADRLCIAVVGKRQPIANGQ